MTLKRKVFFILSVLIFALISIGLWLALKEPGLLKEVQWLTYRPEKGTLILKDDRRHVNEYDNNGHKTCMKIYQNGKLSQVKKFHKAPEKVVKTYDANNTLKSIQYQNPKPPYSFIHERLNKEGTITSISMEKKDSKGNIIERSYYDGNKNLRSKSQWVYDSKGNKTEYIIQDASGKLRSKRKLFYSPKGMLIKEIDVKPDGSYRNVWDYLFNKEGKTILKRCTSGGGKLHLFTVFDYQSGGKRVIEKEYWLKDNSPLTVEMITKVKKQKQIGGGISVYNKKKHRIEYCQYRIKDDGTKYITCKIITKYSYYLF